MKFLFKGGRVIDPKNKRDERCDLLVERGKIVQVGKHLSPNGSQVIDADGLWVVPGLMDMHVHLRQPGREDKETILTGSRAAAKGGFTSVLPMANTDPVVDNRGAVEFLLSEAKRVGLVNVFPVAAVTKGLKGEELSEIGELASVGCVALSDDGKPIHNAKLMRHALEYAAMFGLPIIAHEQDPSLFEGGVMHEGYTSTVLGLRGIPSVCESIMVARDIELVKFVGGKVHFAHVSSERSIELIREAKRQGLAVTCETAPHYFSLTDKDISCFDANFKMNPPLRSEEDVEAVKKALKDGTIDCIATDHAPHTEQEKDTEFDAAPFGIIGLESSLGLCLSLVHTGVLTPSELVSRMSLAPATLLGLPKGTLSIGMDADITVIDPDETWTLRSEDFESKSKNSPFVGRTLKGRAKITMVSGRIVMKDGKITKGD
ncbi:MAG: dihydroorotase [Candidatus Omnitrophica bacterium]|nr:dihydroorotase [Candidatus Omnitrophota bacterium]